MVSQNISFVCLAKASTQTDAIRIRLLLDRAGIPYRVKNEMLHTVYGLPSPTLFGPMEFMIPINLREEAESVLEELFDIQRQDFPKYCPACDAPTLKTRLDCPSCGLHLG